MRRVVVPLDGTELAAAALPDARRLAGLGGEIILVHEAKVIPRHAIEYRDDQRRASRISRNYLEDVATDLHGQGMRVQTLTMATGDAAVTVGKAVEMFDADMIAVATHGRHGLSRLVQGSAAWRMVTHSGVPVLVRHIHKDAIPAPSVQRRRIMVPLDGSPLAETALRLTERLAREWNAEIFLVRVIPPMAAPPRALDTDILLYDSEPLRRDAEAYLTGVAAGLKGEVQTHVLAGVPADFLIEAADEWNISDVVMASHGRAGLSLVILGSVTGDLIQHLSLPIIIVPARASSVLARGRTSHIRRKSDATQTLVASISGRDPMPENGSRTRKSDVVRD